MELSDAFRNELYQNIPHTYPIIPISHPFNRILLNYGSFRNVDMCRELKMNVSSIHRHIEILKQADLIHVEYAMHEYHITLHQENYQLYVDQLN